MYDVLHDCYSFASHCHCQQVHTSLCQVQGQDMIRITKECGHLVYYWLVMMFLRPDFAKYTMLVYHFFFNQALSNFHTKRRVPRAEYSVTCQRCHIWQYRWIEGWRARNPYHDDDSWKQDIYMYVSYCKLYIIKWYSISNCVW